MGKIFNKLNGELVERVKEYCIKTGSVNDTFHIAIRLSGEMNERSHNSPKYALKYTSWLKYGGTIKLKRLLYKVEWNENNLSHFNAFCLLDAVSTLTQK